jgi:hypothetical protein
VVGRWLGLSASRSLQQGRSSATAPCPGDPMRREPHRSRRPLSGRAKWNII